MQENWKKLFSIVKIFILLGRQNIPFQGHWNDRNPFKPQSELKNEGNFREFLRFRIDSGDKNPESHVQNSFVRSTYTSKTTYNKVIYCCCLEIVEKILNRVTTARYYLTNAQTYLECPKSLWYFDMWIFYLKNLWYMYASTSIAKPNIHGKKLMLCI